VPSAKGLRDRLREAIEYVSGPADDVTRWAEARDDGSEQKTGYEDSGYDEHGAKRPRTHRPSLDASGPGHKADVYGRASAVGGGETNPREVVDRARPSAGRGVPEGAS
jgi:hypothetical protein